VITLVAIFYSWILFAALRQPKGEGELAYGNVHV
jgi:uncharacterized membrane protein